jgi:hypothetical protein
MVLDEAQARRLRDEGHRRVRRQRIGEDGRAGTRPAAAMRRREGLVQVDVHRIDAEITRAHPADDGVEVRAVAIEIAAGLVDQVGDLLDVASRTGRRCWGWSA